MSHERESNRQDAEDAKNDEFIGQIPGVCPVGEVVDAAVRSANGFADDGSDARTLDHPAILLCGFGELLRNERP